MVTAEVDGSESYVSDIDSEVGSFDLKCQDG